MKNKSKSEKVVTRLMKKHNLSQEGWTWSWFNHKRTFGLCNYTDLEIKLSQAFVANADFEETVDTILHEIAHALVEPRNNHNRIWVLKAHEIGCTGNKYCSVEVLVKVELKTAPLNLYCGNCNHEELRYRSTGKCPRCGSIEISITKTGKKNSYKVK